jgi:TatD DNase family protein
LGSELPPLDCHAHIATDVTPSQVRRLGSAQVFAVTRSLREAEGAADRRDPNLTWGCGVHPGDPRALESFTTEKLRVLIARFAIVGEVGLESKASSGDLQRQVLHKVLEACTNQPVLISIHSSGAAAEVVDLLAETRPAGAILHWFTGTADTAARAARLGAYFSVSSAMRDDQLGALPRKCMLPETDFPNGEKRGGGSLPGDIAMIERRLATLWSLPSEEVRRLFYHNLRDIAVRSGAIERLPEVLTDLLLSA